jgi:signal peptidase I
VRARRTTRWCWPGTRIAVLASIVLLGCSPGTHYRIQGDAMWPTLRQGAVAAVNPLAYGSVASVRRGDVVVHIRPGGGPQLKRVVAIPGDLIEVKGGLVYLGGKPLRQEWVRDEVAPRMLGGTETRKVYREWLDTAAYEVTYATCDEPVVELQVPGDSLFLLGDNRCASIDSRHFGSVPFATLKGRLLGVNAQQ